MSARGLSQRAITTARGMPTAAHSSHWATIVGSIGPSRPALAGTTNSAASAARSPARRVTLGAFPPLGDDRGVARAFAARVGGYDEQRGVGGAKPRAQRSDEVAVSRGVDQVDLGVRVQEGSDGQAHRALLADGG